MPKVSVIIPVYGVEKYIERCATSLFEQTLDDIEYIFVDDCTLDRSMEILGQIIDNYRLRFAEKKYTVRTERMLTNSGVGAVGGHGINLATGDYIIHCDSDDWVDTDMYRAMYEEAITKNADVVVCDYDMTDGVSYNKRVNACHSFTPKQMIENCLFQRDPWSVWNKLVKRTTYGNITYPQGAMGEDMVITLQILWNCKAITYIPQPFYKYFYNPESITKVITRKSCIKQFEQLSANTEIIMNFLQDKQTEGSFAEALVVYKNAIRAVLYPLVYDKYYYKKWNNMFTGLNLQVFCSKHIRAAEKIRVLLTILHLHPRKQFRACK